MEGSAAMIEREVRHLERCRTCNHVLPVPPAPRVCEKCGAVKIVPHHSDWSHETKVFLLLQHLGRNFFSTQIRPVQRSWELLLINQYEGRFVGGKLHRQGCDPDTVYALAVKEAEEWRLAGGKTDFL